MSFLAHFILILAHRWKLPQISLGKTHFIQGFLGDELPENKMHLVGI